MRADTRPRQPSPAAGDGADLPDPAVRADLLLGRRALAQRRRPLRRRRVRLALPHAVREQLAVQAAQPVRVPLVLAGARRRREPRCRRRPRPSRRASSPPSSSREPAWARTRDPGTCSSAAGTARASEIVRELHAREVEDKREIVILADRETTPLDEKGITFIRGNPSSADDLNRAGLETRVDRHRPRRRVEPEQRTRRRRRPLPAHDPRGRDHQPRRVLVRRGGEVGEPRALRAHPRRRAGRERRAHRRAARRRRRAPTGSRA